MSILRENSESTLAKYFNEKVHPFSWGHRVKFHILERGSVYSGVLTFDKRRSVVVGNFKQYSQALRFFKTEVRDKSEYQLLSQYFGMEI